MKGAAKKKDKDEYDYDDDFEVRKIGLLVNNAILLIILFFGVGL